MAPPPIDPKILAALGLGLAQGCFSDKDDSDETFEQDTSDPIASACLSPIDTGPCLSPVDTSDSGVGPCLSPIDTGETGDTGVGPCLSPPQDTGDSGEEPPDTAESRSNEESGPDVVELIEDSLETLRQKALSKLHELGILPDDLLSDTKPKE